MNDTPGNDTLSSNAASSTSTPEIPLLQKFILEFVKTQPIETLRSSYRLTPKGLFLTREVLAATLEYFQNWLCKNNNTEQKLSERKLTRKLFEVEEPELLYLLEGKTSLVGFLAACPIDNPQNLRVPYYLGSASPARDYLHAGDPLFASLKGVRAVGTQLGLEIFVRCGDKEICLPSSSLQHFRLLASSSHQVEKHFPKFQESLAETARAAIGTLERSRSIKSEQEPLRPLRWEKSPKITFRERWGLVFVIDAKNQVQFIYHLYGKNLHNLLRDEISNDLARQTNGQFEGMKLFNRSHQLLGTLSVLRKNTTVHAHALASFIHAKLEDQNPSKVSRTVKYYLSEFILSLTRSQPIDARKVANQLKPQFLRGHTILVNQRWLFIINNKGVLVECVSRFREQVNKNVRNIAPSTPAT